MVAAEDDLGWGTCLSGEGRPFPRLLSPGVEQPCADSSHFLHLAALGIHEEHCAAGSGHEQRLLLGDVVEGHQGGG